MSGIRLARVREASILAGFSREHIETGLGWSWRPERLRRAIRDRETNVIVAEWDGATAGFAAMKYLDEHAHLMLFAVLPQWRRRGIGRDMWSWLADTAATAGLRRVNLEVRARNTGARSFYRELGFTETETVRGYYRGVEAAVRMRLDIAEVIDSRLP